MKLRDRVRPGEVRPGVGQRSEVGVPTQRAGSAGAGSAGWTDRTRVGYGR